MKIAILETVVPTGHEVEYDRGLVQELLDTGHDPVFFVPQNYPFKADYGINVEYLKGGEAISYRKAGFIKKTVLSITRELRRRRWFSHAKDMAESKNYDLIVIPTATPRYLKALLGSRLCYSKVPVIVNMQVFSFEKKGRLEQFLALAKKLEKYPNVHITITSPNHALSNLPNVSYLDPPFYVPSLIKPKGPYDGHEPLIIGLYGFYRHDLNTRLLFKILATSSFTTPIKLIMQTVTNNAQDEKSCREIVEMYKDNPRFTFTSAYLSDATWQKALDDTDIIIAPYASMQYIYTYSAMCFNALGFEKPVILSPTVNPEVLKEYNVGISLDFDDEERLKKRIEKFINTFKEQYPNYLNEIHRAHERYSFKKVVQGMLNFAQKNASP